MNWIAQLFSRRRRYDELSESIREHLNEKVADMMDRGMTRDEAEYAARREFGNVTQIEERSREVWHWPRLESILADFRFASRLLWRAPGFTLAVVATLALGIGATTAIFTLVYSTLLRSLPYQDAKHIVRIDDVRLQGQSTGGLMSVPRFFDVGAQSQSFEKMGFFYFDHPTLIVGTELPVAVKAASADAGFWQVFGVQPLLGRTFNERDDQPNMPNGVVLSYAMWQRIFGGDTRVIGKQVMLDQKSATIIGVMPQDFNVPNGVEMWQSAQFAAGNWSKYRGDPTRFINVYARLAPGTTLKSAQSDLKRIGEQLRKEYAATDGMWQFSVSTLRDAMYGGVRPALVILQIASGFLLFVACLNVANLLLSRAAAREREVALRRALGAPEARIQMQFLTESALLAGVGGSVGVALAVVLVHAMAAKLPVRLGAPEMIGLNWPVACFAAAVTVAAGIGFGLAPALRNRRTALSASLKTAGQHLAGAAGGRVRDAFIAVQVGLSMVLLVGATLLGQSLWNLMKLPLGFVPDHLLTFHIDLPWGAKPEAIRDFYANVQRKTEALPGVTAVGQISALPTEEWHRRISFDGDWLPQTAHHDSVVAEARSIAGDPMRAMGIPLLAGRPLTGSDKEAKSPPVLVNHAFAEQYGQGIELIGKHLVNDYGSMEIVGIIGDVRGTAGSIAQRTSPEMYFSADGQYPDMVRAFVVRTSLEPEQLIQAIREQVHEADPQQAMTNVSTMDELLDKAIAQPRLNMALVAVFAGLALLLACVGIYGVVAWSVAQRVREIGVRMALGATQMQVELMFMRRAMTAAVIGVLVGSGAALLLARLARSQLYGIAPNDLAVYAVSAVLVLLPVLLAALRPALVAGAVNPIEALRVE